MSRTSLMGRRWDFWLMGGVSLLVWVAMMVVTSLRDSDPWAAKLMIQIGLGATIASFLVFQPHFIFTYRMAYGRGWSFILRRWPQLIGLPLLLFGIYLGAYLSLRVPIESSFVRSSFPQAASLTYGQLVLSLVLSSMFLMLGWHHSKQTFGCMMVYRKFDRYPVSLAQRKLLLGSLYGLWAVNVVVAQSANQLPTPFYGLPLFSLTALEPFRLPVILGSWSLVLFSLIAIISSNWRKERRWPSPNFLIPYVAILLWWAPPFYQRDFYIWFSTVFHALQYWPFAVRYEQGLGKRPLDRRPQTWLKFFIGGALLGALPIFIPMAADVWLRPDTIQIVDSRVGFFVIAVQTSLNIHHYFLDSVIWRLDQPQVKEYICGEPTSA